MEQTINSKTSSKSWLPCRDANSFRLADHEEQTSNNTVKIDDSGTHGTNTIAQEDPSSCLFKSGVVGVLQRPISENVVSVSGITNSLNCAPSTGSSVQYIAKWFAQRPHKVPQNLQPHAVSLITNNDESPMSSQGFTTCVPGSGNSFKAAHTSPLGSCLGNNYSEMETKFDNASTLIGLSWPEESGVRENKLKGNAADAVGATSDAERKAGAFKRKSSDDIKGQGRTISVLTDFNPRVKKIESLPSKMPTHGMKHISNKDKSKFGRTAPKKQRNSKVSVLTGQYLNGKASDNTGELDDDHEKLIVASDSVHNAGEHACSCPFWKEMERFFAPVITQDLLFLKQKLDSAKEFNQSQCQIFGHKYGAAGVSMRSCISREASNLDQGSVKSTAFGMLDAEKTFNVDPPFIQRVLSAFIDEDGDKDFSNPNGGGSIFFQCMNNDSHLGSSHIYCGPKNRDRVESEVGLEVDLQSQKCLPVDGLSCNRSASSCTNSKLSVSSGFSNQEQWQADDRVPYSNSRTFNGNDYNDPTWEHSSQFNMPPVSQFNCQYQMLSLNDKLLLELRSIGLNPETMPVSDDGEEWIDGEINELQGELNQRVEKVKNNLRKFEKGIQCEQELAERKIEESAMDQLVEMAFKSMGGRPFKSLRIHEMSKQVALAFVKCTLARCKQFEDSGTSCFSQSKLQDIIFCKTPSEKDVKLTDRNGLMMVNKKFKESRNKAKRKGSANGPVVGAIERLDSQSNNLQKGSSELQQTLTQSSNLLSEHSFLFNKWKKELLVGQIDGSASKATEVTSHPGQVHAGFSGAEQPWSRPSGLFSRYDFSLIKGKSKVLGEIAGCSSAKENFSRQDGLESERGVTNRDQRRDVVARNFAAGSVRISKAKSKRKRSLSRIGLQELVHSAQSSPLKSSDTTANSSNKEFPSPAQLLAHKPSDSITNASKEISSPSQLSALKSSDPIANANNEFPSPANGSEDVSRETRSVKTVKLDALAYTNMDVSNIFSGPEDLNSLLDFDEEGLLDHDSAGLEVPMDNLSDIDMFF